MNSELLVDIYEAYLEAESQVMNDYSRTDKPEDVFVTMFTALAALHRIEEEVDDYTGGEEND